MYETICQSRCYEKIKESKMSKPENGNLHEFTLQDEIFNTTAALIGFGVLFGFVVNVVTVFMGQPGNLGLWTVIGMIVFGGVAIAYALKLYKFDKKFGVRAGNEYNINKIKDYYGAPINIIEDKDNSYYTFREEIFGMFAKIHTFTTDKSGIVKKHEVSFIGTNKKG